MLLAHVCSKTTAEAGCTEHTGRLGPDFEELAESTSGGVTFVRGQQRGDEKARRGNVQSGLISEDHRDLHRGREDGRRVGGELGRRTALPPEMESFLH